MIVINNLTTSPVDEKFLQKIAKIVLEEEKKKSVDLSIVLVGQRRIRELNKKYRGKNRVTDVLAFGGNSEFRTLNFKSQELGDVVICPKEIKKNATRYKTTFEKELARVLIHGILHLLGYEHEQGEAEAKRMREKEEYYLLQLKF